ncbi:MAG TPA: NADPH-dependent FMN reductase [Acidimicrobiales bacterium]|nr:NADPH-dependent FMN reductase [Acidimicrobiales bacterium]
MRVMVLSAISREDSSCFILAAQLCEMAHAQGVEVDFTHPADANLPVNDGTLAWDDPRSVAWQQRVETINAHLWVSPEYHSGMTGGMKNLFDHLAKEPMKGDVVGLFALAGGAMAALNTLNNMSVVARSLGAWVAPDYCALNSNEVKEGLDERAVKRVESVVGEVIDTARRLNLEGF